MEGTSDDDAGTLTLPVMVRMLIRRLLLLFACRHRGGRDFSNVHVMEQKCKRPTTPPRRLTMQATSAYSLAVLRNERHAGAELTGTADRGTYQNYALGT